MGVEQTEIDTLATLRPELLEEIVTDALDAYYDDTLDDRLDDAIEQWETEAQEALESQLGPDLLDKMRRDAEEQIDALHEQVDALNDALRINTDGIDLPDFAVPAPAAVDRFAVTATHRQQRQLRGRDSQAQAAPRLLARMSGRRRRGRPTF